MDIKKARHVLWVSYSEYARAYLSAWRIFRFYRACGCSIRIAVSRAKRGRDPYQWLVEEQEKAQRAELRAQLDLARPPENIRDHRRRAWHANSRHRKAP